MVDPTLSPDGLTSRSQTRRGRPRRRKIRLAAGIILLLLLVIVAPPYLNINRFRRSIVQSISAGLGRPVHASAVELILFPRPAFVLHDLTVEEDPAYGAEPVLMADTVTASLRASTLWHRRVEIASLQFDAPSLNVARNGEGRWNFESLLHHSSAWQSAAVASSKSNPPPFPYVEATGARINFKVGSEKLPFSLEGADLALWKEPGNAWHLRLQARPVRTDLTIADAGQIRGEAVVLATGPLPNAPVRATLEWRRVQLGEISRLLHGEDEGWRGTVDWTAKTEGTLADLLFTSDIHVDEFRRDEFVPPGEMDLSAHCQARYRYTNWSVTSLECHVPLENGLLTVRGQGELGVESGQPAIQPHRQLPRISTRSGQRGGPAGTPSLGQTDRPPQPSLEISLQHAPAGFFLRLLRHVHPGVASDATAAGELNGEASCNWPGLGLETLRACTGEVRSTALTISLPPLQRPLRISPLVLTSGMADSESAPPTAGWVVQPAHLSLGAATPATVSAILTPTGSTLKITGAADLAGLFDVAQALRIPAISGQVRSLRGSALLALTVNSVWMPQPAVAATVVPQAAQFTPSRWSGSIQTHNATLQLVAFPGTVQLSDAQVNLTPTTVDWTGLNGTYDRVPFDGSLHWQTPCATSTSICSRTFALHLRNLNTGHLQSDLRSGSGQSELMSLVEPWAGSVPKVPRISGTVNMDMITLGKISVKNAAINLSIEGHQAELHSITGNVFGGTLSSVIAQRTGKVTGSMQWGNGAPSYTLHVALAHVQPDSIAAIWREHWGRGQANVDIQVTTKGWSAEDLADRAAGKFSVAWVNGAFASPTMTATPMARFQQWDAKGIVANKSLQIQFSQMVPQSVAKPLRPATQSVTGTISFTRKLDLQFEPSGMALTGTLARPNLALSQKSRTNQAVKK